MQHRVEVGREGRVRDRMVSLPSIVAIHTLKEQIGTRAKSLIYDRNHGVWEGTGTTHGVLFETIPEIEHGATFDGNGRVRVANDGAGFVRPGDVAARTLSLANGDGDIFWFMKTTHNSATERCIVHKQDSNDPTENGFKIAYKNGQVICFLRVAGVTIFNFARDYPYTDGREHIGHLHFSLSVGALARLTYDGIPAGADAPCTAEPALTGGDYCIAGFGNNTGGFIGTLGLIGLSRQGDETIGARLNACRAWTPLASDIRVETEPLETRHGQPDAIDDSGTAPPGSLTFTLDNSPLNSVGVQGYYTPDHADAMTGWKENIPIRWVVTGDDLIERTRFVGTVTRIQPEPGLARDQRVQVTCETWLRQAMRARVKQLPLRLDIRSDDAIRYLIDQVDRPPRAIDLDVGESTFPIVFDDLDQRTPVYQEMARIVQNEGGQLFEQPDGTLRFESRSRRLLPETPEAFWDDDDLEELEADRGLDQIANSIPFTLTPRRIGATANEVLASMQERILLTPGEAPIPIAFDFRDPDNPNETVSATEVTVPQPTTDYNATETDGGNGANLTSQVVLTCDPVEDIGGSSIRVTVSNSGALPCWFIITQVRGRSLKKFDSQTFYDVRDDASVLEHDELEDPISFDYLTAVEQAREIAGRRLALRRTPFMAARVAHRRGLDEDIQGEILDLAIGRPVSIAESMSGLTGDQRGHVQGIDLTLDNILVAAFSVTRAQGAQPFWILEEEGLSELDDTTWLG